MPTAKAMPQENVHFQPSSSSEGDEARLSVKSLPAEIGAVAETNATETQPISPAQFGSGVFNPSLASMGDLTTVCDDGHTPPDWAGESHEAGTDGDDDDSDDQDHCGGGKDDDVMGEVSDPDKRDADHGHAQGRSQDIETDDGSMKDAPKPNCGQGDDVESSDDPSPSSVLSPDRGIVGKNPDRPGRQMSEAALQEKCQQISPSLSAYIAKSTEDEIELRKTLKNLREDKVRGLEEKLRALKERGALAHENKINLLAARGDVRARHPENPLPLQRLINTYRIPTLHGATKFGQNYMQIACRLAAQDATMVFAVRHLIYELHYLLGREKLREYLDTYTGTGEDAESPKGCDEWASRTETLGYWQLFV